MRVVFIGANWKFSVTHLNYLLDHHKVVGIVNSVPNTVSIPGKSLMLSVKKKVHDTLADLVHKDESGYLPKTAKKLGIPFILYNKTQKEELRNLLKQTRPDIIVVASMSQLLPLSLLEYTKYGAINVHGSFLPEYKSKNPFFWQLLNGDFNGGVTIHYIDKGVDAGNILEQIRFPLNYGISSDELVDSLSNHSVSLLPGALKKASEGDKGIPQQQSDEKTYFEPFEKSVDYVKWDEWSIERTWHFLFGVQRWYVPPAAAALGKKVKIGSFTKEHDKRGETGALVKVGFDYYLQHPEGIIKVYLGE